MTDKRTTAEIGALVSRLRHVAGGGASEDERAEVQRAKAELLARIETRAAVGDARHAAEEAQAVSESNGQTTASDINDDRADDATAEL